MTFKKRPPYLHIERLPKRPTKVHNGMCEHGACDWCPQGCFDSPEVANEWTTLINQLICGGCEKITMVESPYTCKTCGRMLCGKCGEYCKDHKPTQ